MLGVIDGRLEKEAGPLANKDNLAEKRCPNPFRGLRYKPASIVLCISQLSFQPLMKNV